MRFSHEKQMWHEQLVWKTAEILSCAFANLWWPLVDNDPGNYCIQVWQDSNSYLISVYLFYSHSQWICKVGEPTANRCHLLNEAYLGCQRNPGAIDVENFHWTS